MAVCNKGRSPNHFCKRGGGGGWGLVWVGAVGVGYGREAIAPLTFPQSFTGPSSTCFKFFIPPPNSPKMYKFIPLCAILRIACIMLKYNLQHVLDYLYPQFENLCINMVHIIDTGHTQN